MAGLGLEQMEESLLEGNKESLLLLWSLSTRGKNQSLPSLGWCQPSMMMVQLAFRQMTLCLVKVTLRPASQSGENAKEGPGKVVHDMTMTGSWRYVLVVDLSGGGGGLFDAIGNFHLDAGGGSVEMGDGGILAEVEAAGAGVNNTKVGFGQGGGRVVG